MLVMIFSSIPTVVGEDKNLEDIQKELDQNVNDSLDKLDLSELEQFGEYINASGIYDGDIKSMIDDILSGKFSGNPKGVFDMILSILGVSIQGLIPMLVMLLAIAVVFSIMNGLSAGFVNKSITEIIYFVCYATISVVLITGIAKLIKSTVDSIDTMSKLMSAVFPILITLVTALGGVASSGVYQPLMAILAVGVSGIIKGFVLPCFITTMSLSVVGNISQNVKLDKLTSFFKTTGSVVLGLVFSVFMAFVTVQGITGAVADSISVKSAKFAISSYVPILGGYLSEGFDLVLASVVLVKNAVGMCAVILMLAVVLAPVINITVFLLGLRLVAGVIEPIGDKRMSDIIYTISNNLTLLITSLLGIIFMFFMMVTLIILTCNMGV